MKKLFWFIAALMVCASITCVSADECEHVYRMEPPRYNFGFFPVDANTHEWRDYYYGVCQLCSDRALMYLAGDQRFHEFELQNDAHYVNTERHYYFYHCPDCGYTYTISLYCSGEFCDKLVQINRIKELVHDLR